MPQLSITGGIPLSGEIAISGAKNATLPILAACLLASEPVMLSNVPHLRDVTDMLELLGEMGVLCTLHASKRLEIQVPNRLKLYAPYELTNRTRASILVLGPLLSRFNKATVSLPGGCAIGDRPINLHITGLEAMGARIKIEGNTIYADCPKGLQGTTLDLEVVSVTTTENLMMAAVLAKGKTLIKNAAREPEVVDLANFLNTMGARIYGAGDSVITIEGVDQLKGGKHCMLPDRLEAATLLIAAACTQGSIKITQMQPQLITTVLQKLELMGNTIIKEDTSVTLQSPSASLKAIDIQTAPYPGFPTDIQAQMMVLNTIAEGVSNITETIFENRFLHVAELKRMGADIQVKGRTAICKGVKQLFGARVVASDLRACASLVLAGLIAKGETLIERSDYIDRGYEYFEEKFFRLGANIHLLS